MYFPFGFEQSSYHTVVLDDTIPPGVPSEYVVLSIGEERDVELCFNVTKGTAPPYRGYSQIRPGAIDAA